MINDPTLDKSANGSVYLPRCGLRCSRICFGTMTFGAQLNKIDSHRLLDIAFDKGVNYFDTANAYSAGESERILGSWAKTRRNQVVISTKIRYQVGDDLMSVGLSGRTVKAEVDRCLKRLETDYVDILYLHQPDDATDIDETLRAVDDLIRSGKVHVLGVSNFAAWQIMEAHWMAANNCVSPPLIVQPMYNLISRGIEQELLPCCKSLNLAVYVYNPLAAGLLTGKHNYSKGVTLGGRFEVFPYYVVRYWTQKGFEAVSKLERIAKGSGRELTELALQWVLVNPAVTGLLIGASSQAQLEMNLSAFETSLEPDVLEECDQVWQAFRGPVAQYNR